MENKHSIDCIDIYTLTSGVQRFWLNPKFIGISKGFQVDMPKRYLSKIASDSGFDEQKISPSQLLREGDRSQFLCSLFLPEPHRAAAIALYTFKLEIARVGRVVSDPLIGQLRLKWWYDAVKNLENGKILDHPVVIAIDRVFQEYELDPSVLLALVEAYSDALVRKQPEQVTGLFTHLDRTLGDLNSLIVHVIAGGASDEAVNAAYHVTRAWGISQLLLSLPKSESKSGIYIPKEILSRESVTFTDLMKFNQAGHMPDSIIRVIRTVVEIAEEELSKGRRLRSVIAPPVRSALLIGILAEQDLAAIKMSGFDPRRLRHGRLEPGPMTMVKLWWGAQRGRY